MESPDWRKKPARPLNPCLRPQQRLYWIPRLSGFCLDSNRAGFILVMYLALLDRFAAKTSYTRFLRFAIACFIFLSLYRDPPRSAGSRITYSLLDRFWKNLVTARAAFRMATLAISFCLLVGLVYRQEIAGLVELWQLSDIVSDRLSSDPGSTGRKSFSADTEGFRDLDNINPHRGCRHRIRGCPQSPRRLLWGGC